jgi:N-acetyl-gamma-glutamyl-phosphate reductase
MAITNKLRIGILGASGYTGAELLRLLARHPGVEIKLLTADRQAGKPIAEIFPHLGSLDLPIPVKIEDADWSGVDFRLTDIASYATWYGHEHRAPELQKQAVYGLTELARAAVAGARLVANPGCYPTSAQLPLMPLLEAGLISADDIIIDAKSGVTGAGRDPKQQNLYAEVTEGIHAYGIASHRHAPEIEQGLSEAAGKKVTVNFTPHLMPMSRGILSTIYVRLANGSNAEGLRQELAKRYAGEAFVRMLPPGQAPATRHVRGSNHCLMNVFADRVRGRAILVSVIDNLVKGASGQAVQNMNVMAGWPETTALDQQPLFP